MAEKSCAEEVFSNNITSELEYQMQFWVLKKKLFYW